MVQVILAGYQLDAEVARLSKLATSLAKEGKNDEAIAALSQLAPDMFTPEVISAAYARISRDERSIPELRTIARVNVEAAKKSNQEILFGQGHGAVADGFMFNFDVLDISRLAVEELEARRIGCGYVEKSQRYITLHGDFTIPKEFSPEDAKRFVDLVEKQVIFYNKGLDKLLQYQIAQNPAMWASAMRKKAEGVSDKGNRDKNAVEGFAKEDTRYGISLATLAQVGTSFNARALQHTIRITRYSDIQEGKDISKQLFTASKDVAPSLICLTDPDLFREYFNRELVEDNYRETRRQIVHAVQAEFARRPCLEELARKSNHQFAQKGDTKLVGYGGIDANIIAALLFSGSTRTVEECYAVANELANNLEAGMEFMKTVLQFKSEFDAAPREHEIDPGLNFAIELSSSAFAQMKRHRMMTLLHQDYMPELDITVPESVRTTGLEPALREICEESSNLYREFKPRYGRAAEYVLTNAHKRRVFVHTNCREMYSLAGMRCDSHAQWDIRKHAGDMLQLAIEKAPIALMLACGKDKYQEMRRVVYSS